MSNGKFDDFWNLEKEIDKKRNAELTPRRAFKSSSTTAVEVELGNTTGATQSSRFSDSPITKVGNGATRFVPPHEQTYAKKKYIEYIHF